MSRPSLTNAPLTLCALLLAALCAACMPHASDEQCLHACAFTLDNLNADLSQLAQAPPADDPLPDTAACVQACRAQLVPVEYHCLVRAFDSHEVQACFDRPRTNAHRFDYALKHDPQRGAEHDARVQRLLRAPR